MTTEEKARAAALKRFEEGFGCTYDPEAEPETVATFERLVADELQRLREKEGEC